MPWYAQIHNVQIHKIPENPTGSLNMLTYLWHMICISKFLVCKYIKYQKIPQEV